MKIHIKRSGLISDVQKEFTSYFPYLRIDFFRFPHADKTLSPKSEKLDRYTPVDRIVQWDEDKVIEMNEKMTVSEFESLLERVGVFVQIFRKSGRVWIETSYTDDWTLERQNEEGEMMSSIHDIEPGKQIDWDDWLE